MTITLTDLGVRDVISALGTYKVFIESVIVSKRAHLIGIERPSAFLIVKSDCKAWHFYSKD
jgi:hypothetical protein